MPTAGVDFFRVDRSVPTRRILFVASSLVAIGASAVGAHLVHRLNPSVGHVVALVGGVMTAAGLVIGFGAMAMMLFDDVWLAIRDEGVVLHDNGNETTIAWDDLASADVEGRGMVALRRKSAEPLRFHAGSSAKTLAAKIADARRKGLHGLLKTGDAPPPRASY